MMKAKYNETCIKSEALTERQNMQEKELLMKTERVSCVYTLVH